MSAPMDLRAVLDAARFVIESSAPADMQLKPGALKEARAAANHAIEALSYAREWIAEVGDRKGIPNGGTLQRIDAALARAKGETA